MTAAPDMDVSLFSFGFKHAPPEAETVFDVRFLPNPYYVPELSPLTGLDRNVAGYVLDNKRADSFLHYFEPFILSYIQSHADSDRKMIRIGIGCTGGKHRSVAVVEGIKKILDKHGIVVNLLHRDIDKV